MPRKKKAAAPLFDVKTTTAPCMPALRERVGRWRADGYPGATETTRRLLHHWFRTDHRLPDGRSDLKLLQYDDFARYCVKMATGSGKTKVMALAVAWQYFNALPRPATTTPGRSCCWRPTSSSSSGSAPTSAAGGSSMWTVCDYPLKQAILDGIVNRPLEGVAKGIAEQPSEMASTRYQAYLAAGVERWKEYRDQLAPLGRRPVLFVMMNDTAEADDVERFAKLPERFDFVIEYTDASGNPRFYEPDFVAALVDGTSYLIETKGLEDVNVANKDRAARVWCENATKLTGKPWSYLKVPQAEFSRLQPTRFADVVFLASE